NFNLRQGEILGIAGMVGSGRTEVAKAIFGIDTVDSGEILLNGKKISLQPNPKDAINNGIVLIPESRKECGLIIINTLRFNMTITILNLFLKFIKWNRKKEENIVQNQVNTLKI